MPGGTGGHSVGICRGLLSLPGRPPFSDCRWALGWGWAVVVFLLGGYALFDIVCVSVCSTHDMFGYVTIY